MHTALALERTVEYLLQRRAEQRRGERGGEESREDIEIIGTRVSDTDH